MQVETQLKEEKGFRALLQYPDFMKIWFGRTISRFGDALDGIAFMWLMYSLTGSSVLMGTVMAVSAIPSLFGMAAGVLVDRMDKKRVMVWMDLLRGVSTAIIALLFMIDALQIWQLYAFAFFNSLCEVFSSPARSSAMQVLVRKEHYLSANSLTQASGATAEIVGMGVAAVLIGLWGPGVAILIDGVTFVISGVSAMFAKIEKVINTNGPLNYSSFFSELLEGLQIIKSNALILINIILGCLINILLAPFNVLMPIYSDKILKAGEWGYSMMGAGVMIGIILGSLIIGQIGHRFKKSSIIIAGLITFGLSISTLGLSTNILLSTGICVAIGLCLPVVSATGMSVVQEYTPREKMGRVSSTMSTIGLLGMPLGYAASGFLGKSLNVQYTYIVLGVVIALICIPPLFNKEFRKI